MEFYDKVCFLKDNREIFLLEDEQIDAVVSKIDEDDENFLQMFYESGFIDEEDFLEKAAAVLKLEYVRLKEEDIEKDAAALMTAGVANHYFVVPMACLDNRLQLVTCDPFLVDLKKEIQLVLGSEREIELVLSSRSYLEEVFKKVYGVGAATVEKLGKSNEDEAESKDEHGCIDALAGEDASVIKLVNQILADAIEAKATDIHVEPYENQLRVKYRVDGMLVNASVPGNVRFFRQGITSRVKIMSGLDIAEKRLPQDGRTQVNLGGLRYDLRVSMLPTRFGEAVNIRILPQSRLIMDLESLGIEKREIVKIRSLVNKPHGIILVTGPTGSGKTTTLYTCMHLLKDSEKKIITIEDPIEYEMNGIVQMQVHSEIGFSFARALRAMLRHDPDIMLVGEIRDLETAQTAIRTALTGHLVFSTLHTNDAASAVNRLLDMGIEPFLVASSVEAILAQRLVRVICPECREKCEMEDEIRTATESLAGRKIDFDVYRGLGCSKCRFTGFSGRTVITELLVLSESIRELILHRRHSNEIFRKAKEERMVSLFENGLEKVKAGITTVDEILRVTA